MDIVRGIAVCAIVIHHWIYFIPHKSSLWFFYITAELIKTFSGTTVHLFFILSGCGLTISYFKKGIASWKEWAKRRIRKIIIPYWIVVTLTFLFANSMHYISPELIRNNYAWPSLFTYLTFTRNFYNIAWGMNPTLWFMPVIIGLYVLFPPLVKILENFGVFILLIFSFLITYSSITVSIIFGYPITHQTALPLFYICEFAIGMYIGYTLCFKAYRFNRFVSLKMLFIGIFLYCLSWTITKSGKLGNAYNDLFTAIGIYLVILYICKWIVRFSPQKSLNLLKRLSKESYVMYLIHGALILFLIKPILIYLKKSPLNSCMTIIFSIMYCLVVFILAKLVSPLLKLPRISLQR